MWYEECDSAFDRWAAAVLRYIKKTLSRMEGTRNYYIAQRAREFRAAGGKLYDA
jgi:hypothetical protein